MTTPEGIPTETSPERRALAALTSVCQAAVGGDLEPRVPHLGEDPELKATRPDVCPANGKIAFTGIRQGRAELWLLDYASGSLTHVPVGSPPRDRLFYASWYADGTKVAVTDYGAGQVLAVDLRSGGVEPLTDPRLV